MTAVMSQVGKEEKKKSMVQAGLNVRKYMCAVCVYMSVWMSWHRPTDFWLTDLTD